MISFIKIFTIYYRFFFFPFLLFISKTELTEGSIYLFFAVLSFQWFLDLLSFYKLKDINLYLYLALQALNLYLLFLKFGDSNIIFLFVIFPILVQIIYLIDIKNKLFNLLFIIIFFGLVIYIYKTFNQMNSLLNERYELIIFYFTSLISLISFMIRKKSDEYLFLKELEAKIFELENPSDQKNKLYYMGQLATTVMHELKNPISTIHNLAETANTDNIGREQRSKNLDLISREITRLSDMAYEIMDFVNGEMKLNLREINLHEFIDEVYSYLKVDFDKFGIKLYVDLQYNSTIKIDIEKMRRVIVNLAEYSLENMSDKRKKYTFTIKSSKVNNKLYLTFMDNGPGLSEEIEDSIFKIFTGEGNFQSSGLSLFMSKRTVEVHGGVLTYSTKKNEGTTFNMILPMKH